MKILKKISAVLAAAAMVLTLAGCGNSENASGSNASGSGSFRTVDQIKESGEIKIGVFSDKNPFGYVDNEGKYRGYDVYFAERIAKDLGVKLTLMPVEAASRVEFLETAKVDIILANFTVTPERSEKVDFAPAYMKVALGVVSPDSAVIKDVSELNGKTLIVVKGTTAETYFTENCPDVKLQKYDEYNEAYSALQDGRGDAFSTDNTEVLAWAKSNPGFTVGIDTLGSTDDIAPAVTKGNATLLNWLKDEMKTLGGEQFFHKDYDETLAAVYGADDSYKENLVVEYAG
ncbi:MAG: cysteine ABC transporter substrate-binding protein [Oscillospiraceae bacterium]|nr:cysteine ABC transporter substrate-binding protein [Oscillospiraceae bacterium]